MCAAQEARHRGTAKVDRRIEWRATRFGLVAQPIIENFCFGGRFGHT